MPKKKNIAPQAIIFDLGGVLIDWNPKHLYQKMFEGNQAEIDYFLNTVCPPEWNARLDAGESFPAAVKERAKLFPDYQPYIHAYWTRWEEMIGGAITETVKILSDLKQRGYPLFVLSNWSADTYPTVYRSFNFLSWFDEVVLSGEEQVVKPDIEIFKRLLARIDYPAEQCLFIDDSLPNIEAADRLGFQTIHFYSAAALASKIDQLLG